MKRQKHESKYCCPKKCNEALADPLKDGCKKAKAQIQQELDEFQSAARDDWYASQEEYQWVVENITQ